MHQGIDMWVDPSSENKILGQAHQEKAWSSTFVLMVSSSILLDILHLVTSIVLFCPRCLLILGSILSQITNFAALWQIFVKLAPKYPCVLLARNVKLTTGVTGDLLSAALRIDT